MVPIPTLNELYTAIIADIQSKYGGTIPSFGKNFLRAQALVQAGKLKLFYLALGNVQKNIFVDTADPEVMGGTLERFARIKLGRNRFPAQAGQYTIEVTGSIGATIAAETTFKSNDDSINPEKLFIIDAPYVLVATTDEITVRALEAGIGSKMAIGEGMTATIPIVNVSRSAIVTGEVVEPLAAETIENYREAALESYRTEPQGGAASDFRLWAKDAQGVEQAYPYAKSGESAVVDLYIEATIDDSVDGKGTPSASLLEDVEEVVELDPDTTKPISERGRRPLGVFEVNYLPVTIREVDVDIADFVGLTGDIETLIYNAIELALSNIRPFVAGADILADKNDILNQNVIISAILNARPGSIFGDVTINIDGSPVSSYQFTLGNIPWLDDVTYS